MEAEGSELVNLARKMLAEFWSFLGRAVPPHLQPWALVLAAALIIGWVGEMAIYGRPGRELCGARTKHEGKGNRHCKKPVTNGGPCGTPGHGSGWVGTNLVLVVLVVAVGAHLGGLH